MGERLRPTMRIRSSTDSSFNLAMELFHHPVHSGMVTCSVDMLNSEPSRKLCFTLASMVNGNSGRYLKVRYPPRDDGSADQFPENVHKKDGFRPSGESVNAGQAISKFATD